MKTSNCLIEVSNLVKQFQVGTGLFAALKGVNLRIGSGEFVAVIGKSGSGKSTLINMITGIDRPTSGKIFINGSPIHEMSDEKIAVWRGRNIGVIFQFFQLLPTLTTIENVLLPMDYCNVFTRRDRPERALALLELVGMGKFAHRLPSELSGGQRQCVAIARALANDPPILTADEPTGNLDSRSGELVFNLFVRLVETGKTILMVTHDDDLAGRVSRVISIADGKIENESIGLNSAKEGEYQEGVKNVLSNA